jgi:hypothetical protein
VHDGTGRRPSILDDHKPYLRQRWNAGCTDAAVLHRELRARGYQGGYSLIRDYLSRFRGTVMPAPAKAVPKTRAVTRWIMTGPASLAHADQAQLDAILQACPELAAVTTCVRGFAAMMTGRRGRDLEKGMTAATATGDPGLRSFITGLRSDQDELRRRRRPRQPHQDAQAPDVRPRPPRPTPPPRPHGRLTTADGFTQTVPEPKFERR